MVARIRKNDMVMVITGKDRGKKGSVIDLNPKKEQLLVKDIALVTRHVKPRRAGETGGIKKEESFIGMSKVMPVCTACNKPTRISSKMLETGKRARMCVKCKETF